MANPLLFPSKARRGGTTNQEGAPAYRMPPAQALLQLASTGCFAGTFHAEPRAQVETVLALATRVDPPTLARVALHARRRGFMKDAPALLLALLAIRDGALFERIFDSVVDTTQAPEREDVLDIGGFSDEVFDLIADFTAGRMGPQHWQGVLDAIDLDRIPAPAG